MTTLQNIIIRGVVPFLCGHIATIIMMADSGMESAYLSSVDVILNNGILL